MKYLHLNEVDFEKYDYCGFDMDGTLYDEQIFIKQAYKKISFYFSTDSDEFAQNIYEWMFQRWIKKGSSYPYIFSEAIEVFNLKNKTIEQALFFYRNLEMKLFLEDTVKEKLEQILRTKLFLITDGNPSLQKNKYHALGLDNYFLLENCCFTGDLGKDFYKPSSLALSKLPCIKKDSKIIYFGDRFIDEQFCLNTGIDFVYVQNFKDFWSV